MEQLIHDVSVEGKVGIYKTSIRPILTYNRNGNQNIQDKKNPKDSGNESAKGNQLEGQDEK